jgi:hypothetical protein
LFWFLKPTKADCGAYRATKQATIRVLSNANLSTGDISYDLHELRVLRGPTARENPLQLGVHLTLKVFDDEPDMVSDRFVDSTY